jgi:hypothetical protein
MSAKSCPEQKTEPFAPRMTARISGWGPLTAGHAVVSCQKGGLVPKHPSVSRRVARETRMSGAKIGRGLHMQSIARDGEVNRAKRAPWGRARSRLVPPSYTTTRDQTRSSGFDGHKLALSGDPGSGTRPLRDWSGGDEKWGGGRARGRADSVARRRRANSGPCHRRRSRDGRAAARRGWREDPWSHHCTIRLHRPVGVVAACGS